jgi:hypothetical protein
MSPAHVAKEIERTRKNLAQFDEWVTQWIDRHPKKMSYVKA